MKVTVSSQIKIQNPTQELKHNLLPSLTVTNPEYEKKARMGLWMGNTPKTIRLYSEVGDTLTLPFGCLGYILKNSKAFEEISNQTHRDTVKTVPYNSHINLYPYQSDAVDAALNARNGIIVMPCGSGKSQVGIELIARIGGKALWLTHTQDLLKQSRDRALSNLGISKADIGEITEGKMKIGNTITFATVQTACRCDIPDVFDVIVCDEVHHAIGSPTKVTMFYNVLSRLSARYKYGLTATPDRTDGLSVAMYSLLGGKIVEIPKSAVANKTVPIDVIWTPTEYEPDWDTVCNPDGTLNFTALINDITSDPVRNQIIKSTVDSTDGSTLILTDRVDHGKTLAEMTGGYFVDAKKKKEREQLLSDFRDGKFRILIATYPLAKEGLDIPTLRNLVMASPIKEKNTVTQCIGRVTRSAEGKTHGTVYDFEDKVLESWQKRRKSIYGKFIHN